LEARGAHVERFCIHPDPGAERRRGTPGPNDGPAVHVIRTRSVPRFLYITFATLWSRPVFFFAAMRMAMRMARQAERRTWDNLMRLAEACTLLAETQSARVEHVHAHVGTEAATVALLCRTLGGPPYSFVAHGPVEFENPGAAGLPEKIRHAAFALADTAHGRSQLLRCSGHEHWEKVHTVRPAVRSNGAAAADADGDASLPRPFAANPHLARFVCVGRLCETKGQRILVEAAALLAAERLAFEIVIVGDGPLRNELEALARLRGLSSRVRFVGLPRGDELAERIAAARAVVLPSLSEGLPGPALEAFAHARPVIATAVAGVAEFVEHGVNGWLVEPGSVSAMADAMRDAIATPVARVAELGEAGFERIARRHDPDAAAERLLPLYRDSIAASRGRRARRAPQTQALPVNGRPKVSVIIVNWNRGDDIAFNLRHLAKADYHNLEVIVVDNGSTDGSPERLAALPGVHLIRLGANLGPSRARNVGIQAATGKYVMFLDSDAVLSKRAISAVVRRMEADPSVGIAGCKIMNWHTRKIDQWIYAEPYETHGNVGFDSYSFSAAGAMCRAEALRDVGGFWERLFIYNEEVDLSIRMLRGGYRIVFAPDARVFHRPATAGRAGSGNYLRLQIRNWIWIYFRYYPRLVCWWKVTSYSAIYLVKGVANRELMAAVRGIVEGLRHASIIREYADDKLSYEQVGLIDSLNRRTAIRLRR
jgi:GT2 family glycosyltransferase/glycosyltransferase involved in cell wall biosynthesis